MTSAHHEFTGIAMEEDQGGYCGIRSPHNFDSCSRHEHSTSDMDSRPKPSFFSPTSPAEPLQTYVIKANGTPVNVFSDEEFVESCSESEIDPNKVENDCERVSKMFNKLVGFLLDVEQYLFEAENITKAKLFKEVTSTRKMLKRNSDLFFDMADFLASKHSSGSSNVMNNEKQRNDEFISHNLVSGFTEVNTKNKVETRKSGSSSDKKTAPEKPKRSQKRRSIKCSSTSTPKQNVAETPDNNSNKENEAGQANENNSNRENKAAQEDENNSNRENKAAQEDGSVQRRRSTRPRARRSFYFNGEKMHLNSVGELIPLSGQTVENEDNQRKHRKRKTMETTPDVTKLKGDDSKNISMKRQLYSPDAWLQHINKTGISY